LLIVVVAEEINAKERDRVSDHEPQTWNRTDIIMLGWPSMPSSV